MQKLFYLLILLTCLYLVIGETSGKKAYIGKFAKQIQLPEVRIPLISDFLDFINGKDKDKSATP